MISRRPSALYRFAQILRVLAILALVFLVLFLATVAYSAVELGEGVAKQEGSLHHSVSATFVGTDILVTITFPIPNQGYYNVRGLTLAAVFNNQTIQSTPLAVTTGGPVNIPGHGESNLSLLTSFDVSNPAAPDLLLHDGEIQGALWLNASYAAVIPVNLEVTFNYHWGAPFANLSYDVGQPVPHPNNDTVAVPVTVHFEDHTPGLSIDGTVAVVVTQQNGTVCVHQSFPFPIREGPNTNLETFYSPANCKFAGATVSSTFTAPGIAPITLPSETIP
jgi:hypothetical protein